MFVRDLSLIFNMHFRLSKKDWPQTKHSISLLCVHIHHYLTKKNKTHTNIIPIAVHRKVTIFIIVPAHPV